jgi:FMN phosphatase YigB (HAD superfamily)
MINEVHADELAGVLHSFGGEVEVLSLDCFDTLLWRTSPDPSDIFCELRPPLSRSSRFVAEKTARQKRFVLSGHREVTLAEIYRCALPGADEAEVEIRATEELALERRHCTAFEPAMALIRNAKRRGLKVIVVSDTYLRTEELTQLIAAKVGGEVMSQIDEVFASSDFGASKLTGLFPIVMDRLGIDPRRVLHVGDNPQADVRCAVEARMQAVHLLQGDAQLEEQWRLELAAQLMAEPTLRHRRPPLLPHRPHLGQRMRRLDDAGARLGYGTLGPLIYGFSSWTLEQARELAAGGRPVKVCFLMRDGYLPKRAYDAIANAKDPPSYAVELSRFAAFASSFRGADDVVSYTGSHWNSGNLDALARQLLFKPAEISSLVAKARGTSYPVHVLTTEALRPHNLKKIVNRSAAVRNGLISYLRRQVDAHPGEQLLLVDTGSVGTVQNRVQDLLTESLGVEVHGRYMLLLDVPSADERKRGFFGPDRVDARLLRAQCNYTSVVEQLCTVAQGSVIGYTDRGEPRRLEVGFSAHQVASRERVQTACLQFIENAGRIGTSEAGRTAEARFLGALAAYTRLLFLPLHGEAEFFEAFVHDVNMGAKETVQLLDVEAAREDLLRIGPMYVKSSLRVFGPGELRRHGLDLALQLLMRRRLDLDLRPADFRRSGLAVPVMVARGQESSIVQLEALPTHDGFYSLSIPIGRCEYAVGILFGQLFEWVQVESARVATVRLQFDAVQRHLEVDLTSTAVHEHTTAQSGGLLHCLQEHSFSFFAPPVPDGDESSVLRVVFRPVVWRGMADATASATTRFRLAAAA